MAKIDLLTQISYTPSSIPGSSGIEVPSWNVTAFGQRGEASLVTAPHFDHNTDLTWFTVDWPEPQAIRFRRFFTRYLADAPERTARAWNGHSFVAAMMGWDPDFDASRNPRNLTAGLHVDADTIQPTAPYATTNGDRVVQSVIGMDEDSVLCAAGLLRPLKIMKASVAQRTWQGDAIRTLHTVDEGMIVAADADETVFGTSYDLVVPALQ